MRKKAEHAPTCAFYYEVPGYPRPVYARRGDSFEVSVYAVWGAVFVTIPPNANATAAVEEALKLAETVAEEQAKVRRSLHADKIDDAPP